MSKKRSNLWCFVGYPGDSLPNNYLSILQNEHIACLVSPIHDKDKNADLSEKKKHIHFMVYYGNGANKSQDQVYELSKKLNGTIPIIVNSRNAMIRYFIHADNPEKKQYSRNDLICLNGFELGDAFDSYNNDNLIYEKIENIIKENRIYNFAILIDTLKYYNMIIELNYLRRHTIYFKELINARYQLQKKDISID